MNKIYPIGFLIIALSIGYYFAIFLPSSNNGSSNTAATLLEDQRRCQEAAMELHKFDGDGRGSGVSQMEARYKYISEENLCVYKGGFITSKTTHEYLKDVMTNETLSEYIAQSSGVVISGDKESFEKSERRYFLGINY